MDYPPFMEIRNSSFDLLCIILSLTIDWVDWATGEKFELFAFYFIPVVAAAWYAGRRAGILPAGQVAGGTRAGARLPRTFLDSPTPGELPPPVVNAGANGSPGPRGLARVHRVRSWRWERVGRDQARRASSWASWAWVRRRFGRRQPRAAPRGGTR